MDSKEMKGYLQAISNQTLCEQIALIERLLDTEIFVESMLVDIGSELREMLLIEAAKRFAQIIF